MSCFPKQVLYKRIMKSAHTKSGRTAKPTRQAILDTLKRSGPTAATQMSELFGVTAMAVRQHLYALRDEDLIMASSVVSGRGRPTKMWALTEKAQDVFPDAHQDLAVDLLRHVEAQFGEQGLFAITDRHAAVQTKAYTAQIDPKASLADKLALLADIRTREGYMAEVQRDGDDWLFIENHCPVCAAARTCTRLCRNELEVFQSVLGPGLQIIREEHILNGPRRCLYRIKTG
jgi:predicted ArsR family transcriptional regulator